MSMDLVQNSLVVKCGALSLGIVIGAIIGPVLFQGVGMAPPAASAAGSVTGAICGYVLGAAAVAWERRRRDREIEKAASSVQIEARLPNTIRMHVHDAQLTIEGEVCDEIERHFVEETLHQVPGLVGFINNVHVRTDVVDASSNELPEAA
jgi:hypothetical protein